MLYPADFILNNNNSKILEVNKSIKVILGCVLTVAFVVVVLSLVVKKKAIGLIEDEVKQCADYQIKYDDIDVSFLRHFPRLSASVEGLSVKKDGEMDLSISAFSGQLALGKVLKNELEMKTVILQEPNLKFFVSHSEKRQDVASVSEPSETTSGDGDFINSFKINSLEVIDGALSYKTEDSINVVLKDIDILLSGSVNTTLAQLQTQLSIASISYDVQGFMIKDVSLSFNAGMEYQMSEHQLVLNDNVLKIGGLETSLRGEMKLDKTPYFDLSFESSNTNIESVLKFLPKALVKNVEHLSSDGEVKMKGFVKGVYTNAESWPAFGADLLVENAWFKYDNLPDKIDNINVVANVSHPEGTSVDSTIISIDDLSMKSGDNFLNTQLCFSTPVSDVTIIGNVTSRVDLAEMKRVIPMQANDIVGKLVADLSFAGKLADIEKENYQDFNATGQVKLNDYYLKSDVVPQGLSVAEATLRFTPERINVGSFSGKLGSSDINFSGYLSNYFGYLFDNKTLRGELKLKSNRINLNEFLTRNDHQHKSASASSVSKGKTPFIVPERLNVVLNTEVKQARLDRVILSDVKGKVALVDSKVLLDDLAFNTLDGSVNINGEYNSQNVESVFSDLDLKIKNVEIAKAAKSISVIRKALPVSQTTQGKISSEMHYYARLDAQGEVDLNSVKSNGYVASPGIRVANNAALNGLASQLKDSRYRDITTSAVRINYKMENSKITFDPFDVGVVDRNINAGGWYSLNNQLKFKIKTTVKAKEIGGDVSKYVSMVSDPNKPLPITIHLSGDAADPNVKLDTEEALKILRKDVTKSLQKDGLNSILKGFF